MIIQRMEKRKISSILLSMINDWEITVNEESRVIMKKIAYYGKIAFLIQISSAYVAIIQITLIKLFIMIWNKYENYEDIKQNFRVMPIQPDCWVQKNISFNFYIVSYVFQTIQVIFTTSVTIPCFFFFCNIAIHLYGQYIVLVDHLKLFKNINNINTELKQKKIIIKFVKRHNDLLKLSKYFEEIYNIIILVDVGTIILLTCIPGFVIFFALFFISTYIKYIN